jgi:trimethylamine--corrinoid protein Co-methyltransferase
MVENGSTQRSTLAFLSQESKGKIHQAVLEVLDGIGMRVFHEEALDLLKRAGCKVESEGRVRTPSALVEAAIRSAPRNISIFNREGKRAMEVGGARSYFGTGSDLLYALDSKQMERHLCTLEDVKRAARVSDSLPNIDFIMSFAYPSDVPPHQAFVAEFGAMAENSTKPIVCTAECVNDLGTIRDIAEVFRGSDERLRLDPYFILYAEPTSPLKHPFHSLDKLLFCADRGVPVIYSPAPNAGAAAPITIAGHVVQGLAECFCGLVIHQLKAEGAPFIMGMGPAVLDMTTSQS